MTTIQRDQKKILVVEDNRETANMFQDVLELKGYEVVKIHGVGQALQALTHESPDLILLDVMLPDISGLELCRFVRRDPRFEKLPIVIVSAKTQPEDIREGLEAGATSYLPKPFTHEELMTCIKQALGET